MMHLTVLTRSASFKDYFSGIPEVMSEFTEQWVEPENSENLYLIHHSSMGSETKDWLAEYVSSKGIVVGICSDLPEIGEMLEMVKLGARSYCNSYMRTAHFQQFVHLLGNGQSWFPPEMMQQTFNLAHKAIHGSDIEQLLEPLTTREKDIATAVTEGLSNKQIALQASITEPTVKSHLTNIFRKLQIKDRVELVLYLKQG